MARHLADETAVTLYTPLASYVLKVPGGISDRPAYQTLLDIGLDATSNVVIPVGYVLPMAQIGGREVPGDIVEFVRSRTEEAVQAINRQTGAPIAKLVVVPPQSSSSASHRFARPYSDSGLEPGGHIGMELDGKTLIRDERPAAVITSRESLHGVVDQSYPEGLVDVKPLMQALQETDGKLINRRRLQQAVRRFARQGVNDESVATLRQAFEDCAPGIDRSSLDAALRTVLATHLPSQAMHQGVDELQTDRGGLVIINDPHAGTRRAHPESIIGIVQHELKKLTGVPELQEAKLQGIPHVELERPDLRERISFPRQGWGQWARRDAATHKGHVSIDTNGLSELMVQELTCLAWYSASRQLHQGQRPGEVMAVRHDPKAHALNVAGKAVPEFIATLRHFGMIGGEQMEAHPDPFVAKRARIRWEIHDPPSRSEHGHRDHRPADPFTSYDNAIMIGGELANRAMRDGGRAGAGN